MSQDTFDRYTFVTSQSSHLALACLLGLTLFINASSAKHQIMLLNNDLISFQEINCDIAIEDSVMTIVTNEEGKDAIADCDVSNLAIDGPVEIQFKMKTEVHGELGEYVVYWIPEGGSDWTRFERVLLRPDGQWHTYRLPLAATGRMRAIRFTFGKQPHQIALSDIQLVQSPGMILAKSVDHKSQTASSVELNSNDLSLRINLSNHVYTIDDSRTGRTWQSEPVSEWLELVNVAKVESRELRVEMYDLFARQPVTAKVEITENRAVRFTLEADSHDLPIASASRYPPRFSSELSDGHFVFCDRSCGVLLNQRDPKYANWPLRVYGNTHCLDMPWVGLFDFTRHDGMMLLVETPADAEVAFVCHEDGCHWPEVRWLPSMDRFGYARSVSLRFSEAGGYGALASLYRDYLKQQKRFKTLKEKSQEKPAVQRLKGAPSLWGGRFPTKFIRQMRPLGIQRGIVGACREPAIVAWLNDLGYLTGRYDNYVDIFEGETGFTSGNVEKEAVQSRPGGPSKHGWRTRSGAQMYWRSSATWLDVQGTFVPGELSQIPFSSRFIDVAAAGDLHEDYHPQHMFDRRQDLVNRRKLYEQMNEYGLVLGTEHGNDWITDLVEYFEGSMSGPFWWSSWPAGHLVRPRRDQLSEDYLKYGMGYAHRVPLWELVYHDCAVTTWYWGDTAGLLYEAAPELADRKDLFNILYGTTPLFWMDGTGFKIPEELHRMLRSYHDTCPLHEVVAFEKMLSHEFLSDDRAVQRTRFSNDTTIVVNFSEEPRAVELDENKVVLAPRGFHALGPGISQQRLWIDDAAQTVIAKDGYLTVESNGEQAVAGVKCNGRVTAFRSSETQWNGFVAPDRQCELNLTEITGWDLKDNLRVCHMDDIGEARKIIRKPDAKGIASISSTDNAWRFAIVRDSPHVQVTRSKESNMSNTP